MTHSTHGRGTAEDGPDAPDCPCRSTDLQEECALAGCGFCRAQRQWDKTRIGPRALRPLPGPYLRSRGDGK